MTKESGVAKFKYVGQPKGAYLRKKDADGRLLESRPIEGDPAPHEKVTFSLGDKKKLTFVKGKATEVEDAEFAKRLRKNSHFVEVTKAA